MIEKHNFHWKEGFFYNFPKKRFLFKDLIKELTSKQIISIIGLRRTGKTTLLKQLIDYLIKSEKVRREYLLYYSFDEEQPKIKDIIDEYETKIGKELLEINRRVYIFLDEIQKLDNWQNQIKYYYDNYKNVKFFVSGSSSLFIRKYSQESLAGRNYEFILNPLSFEEFLIFKGKREFTKKKKLFEESIKKEFIAYQKRQFIEIINETEERITRYTRMMIEKIVFQDIPKIFHIDQPELLLKILKIVASNPGMLSDYESLSNELGINRVTLSSYFFYLEESFLIKKLYNFSRNMITSEKKMKKFYLETTSFFPFLNNGVEETKLVENLIISLLNAKFFWRTPQKYEVDMVVKNKTILPIEVKYTNNVGKKDLKGLLKFMDKFNVNNGVVISKDLKQEKRVGKKKISIIPAWLFLLNKKQER